MYPRFEESSVDPMSRRVGARAGLSGFVAYMKRSDAERAVHDMDGLDWGGNILKVGWSKSVPIPARPIYGKSSAALLGLVSDCSDPTTRSQISPAARLALVRVRGHLCGTRSANAPFPLSSVKRTTLAADHPTINVRGPTRGRGPGLGRHRTRGIPPTSNPRRRSS